MCARCQETPRERDGVEGAAAGPARHAAECLHLSEAGDVPPGNRLKKNPSTNKIMQQEDAVKSFLVKFRVTVFILSQTSHAISLFTSTLDYDCIPNAIQVA